MEATKTRKFSNQVVGNAGLYFVCYELSKRGWNVLPTSRNIRGIDVVIYDANASRRKTVQVKALSKRAPVPLGNTTGGLELADYIIICRQVFSQQPEVFVTTFAEVKKQIHRGEKNGKVSFWLQPKDYESFRDRWDKIGKGFSQDEDEIDLEMLERLNRVYREVDTSVDPALYAAQLEALKHSPWEN